MFKNHHNVGNDELKAWCQAFDEMVDIDDSREAWERKALVDLAVESRAKKDESPSAAAQAAEPIPAGPEQTPTSPNPPSISQKLM